MIYETLVPLVDGELTNLSLEGAPVFSPGYEGLGRVRRVEGSGQQAVAMVSLEARRRFRHPVIQVPLGDLNFVRDANWRIHATTNFIKSKAQ